MKEQLDLNKLETRSDLVNLLCFHHEKWSFHLPPCVSSRKMWKCHKCHKPVYFGKLIRSRCKSSDPKTVQWTISCNLSRAEAKSWIRLASWVFALWGVRKAIESWITRRGLYNFWEKNTYFKLKLNLFSIKECLTAMSPAMVLCLDHNFLGMAPEWSLTRTLVRRTPRPLPV